MLSRFPKLTGGGSVHSFDSNHLQINLGTTSLLNSSIVPQLAAQILVSRYFKIRA
jgi:hypothetical protein